MTDTAAADHATVDMIVNTVHRFFPSFDYRYYDNCSFACWVSFHGSRKLDRDYIGVNSKNFFIFKNLGLSMAFR